MEPGGLPSMGLHRVGHDWSDLAAALKNVDSCLTRTWDLVLIDKVEKAWKKEDSFFFF